MVVIGIRYFELTIFRINKEVWIWGSTLPVITGYNSKVIHKFLLCSGTIINVINVL